MLPPAPAWFSTTTGWPSGARIASATTRAMTSVEPPGANGTIKVTGRAGYAPCARDSDGAASVAPIPASNARREIRPAL